MVKDLIRVGPPQGTINDLDLGVHKEFDKDLRKDFEKELKLAKQEKPEKHEKPNRDLDQVSKKSSGGTKKKMARAKDDESDAEKPEEDAKANVNVQPHAINEKISEIMVSNEGELEIADSDKDLQTIAPEQAYIQNVQAQLFAGQSESAQGEATSLQPVDSQQTADVNAQQQDFQYLTNTEKALMADIGASDDSLAANSMDSQGKALEQNTKLQDVASEVKVQEEKQPTELESKVFSILSKETAKPGIDQKVVQQEVSPKNTEQSQALNQTNATLAKSSTENENQHSQSDSKHQSSSEGQSQALPKYDASHDLAAQVQALHAGQRSFQSHLGAAAAAGGAIKADTPADAMKDENIREIMNQAKYLVTKGGGEMTVRMTPEGMGEVQLKVALENGKINIEMNAQDKSVKKMIEESLSDLKSSLASHQMRVEHVKINNVTAVDTNNQSQFQSDANSSNSSFQNRQQQEMNFQNFANSNSGRGWQQQERGSGSYQTVEAPTVKPAAKSNAYAVANKGSSINMVA